MKRWILFNAFILLLSSFGYGQDSVVFQSSPARVTGSPVVLGGDTLFHFLAPMGAFTAAERAKALSNRLEEVVRERGFVADSLIKIPVDQEYFISYKGKTMMVIRPEDTIGTGLSTEALSEGLLDLLKKEMNEKSERYSVTKIFINMVYTLLIILILALIIFFLNWLFRKIKQWIEKSRTRLFKSIKIHQYEFLTVEREYNIALILLRFLKIFLIIISFLIAFPVVFAIFPATEGITRKIIDLVWGPVRGILIGVINYLPELITIIIIYFLFRYLIRFIRFLSGEVERKALVLPGFHPDWAKPTFNIIRVLLYVFMIVVIFPYLPGSESPVFRGVSVLLGVLISLGSTTLIGNTMAGLVITYMRPYKIGDRIKIDDVVGDVVEKTLMITRIKTIKNEDVTIPNAKILTGYTINYTTPTTDQGLIIHTTVTIGYDAPWRTVHELLINAALKTDGLLKKPSPFVLQTSLDDFYISYQINAYTKKAGGVIKMKSDLHQNILDEFNKAGVEIMSPHYRAERDGNEITIPKEPEPKSRKNG